jgi:hypothetical protein
MKKLVGAYGNKGKGREREIIPIPKGVTQAREVMALFGCSDLTAKASLKRGYYIVDYLKRSICPGPLDPRLATRWPGMCITRNSGATSPGTWTPKRWSRRVS